MVDMKQKDIICSKYYPSSRPYRYHIDTVKTYFSQFAIHNETLKTHVIISYWHFYYCYSNASFYPPRDVRLQKTKKLMYRSGKISSHVHNVAGTKNFVT